MVVLVHAIIASGSVAVVVVVTFFQDDIKQAALMRSFLRKSDGLDLPKTVTMLTGASKEVVYVVGTAHFSKESCEDVHKVCLCLLCIFNIPEEIILLKQVNI